MKRHILFMPKAGNLNHLTLSEEEIDLPVGNQVLVKISHSGLNLADIFACLGLYSATPTGKFVPGLEFSGIVEQAKRSSGFQVGDKVWGFSRFGAYTSRINADPRYLRKIPDGWSLAEAAAFPVQALTAWYGLIELGALKAGQRVLIQSAAGGVGLHALQIVQSKKANPIAIVGRAEKADYLRQEYGLTDRQIVIRPTDAEEFSKRLSAVGGNFDIVLDAVAGKFFKPTYSQLAAAGRYLLFGSADFMPTGSKPAWPVLAYQYLRRFKPDPLSMISENKAVFGFNLIWLYNRIDEMASMVDDLQSVQFRRPLIDSVYSATDALQALERLKSGKTKGKVLISWPNN